MKERISKTQKTNNAYSYPTYILNTGMETARSGSCVQGRFKECPAPCIRSGRIPDEPVAEFPESSRFTADSRSAGYRATPGFPGGFL